MLANPEIIQNNSDIIFNDAYVAITKLIDLSDGDIPRFVIRNYMTELSGFPQISLYGMVELMVRCNGIPKVKKVNLEDLTAEQLTPVIGHLSCNGKDGVYITLVEAKEKHITYLGPDNLLKTETVEELEKRWSGFIIQCIFEQRQSQYVGFSSLPGCENQKQYISTIKVQQDFLSADECDEIIRISEQKSLYERSLVEIINEDGESKESALRTSFSAVLNKDIDKLLMDSVYQKAAALANESIDQMEAIQCVRYSTGQEYRPHFDGDKFNNRIKTILVYLNDDFSGGETSFTEIGVTIRPKKGAALFFYNLDNDGHPLVESAHCGMPVKAGVKYAMNIWIKGE